MCNKVYLKRAKSKHVLFRVNMAEESGETKPFENNFEFWADKANYEKDTCLKLKKIRRKVSIPPSYMGNLKSACTTILNKSLTKYTTFLWPFHYYSIFRYDADISGTLVAYNDKSFKSVEQTVSLKNRPGEAYLNFTLEVDVVIFSPEPGSFLRAVCKEVAFLY